VTGIVGNSIRGGDFVALDVAADKIRDIIVEQKLGAFAPEDIGVDEDLLDGKVALDSLDCLSILIELETQFGLDLSGADIDRGTFQSIESLEQFVRLCSAPQTAEADDAW
jgi:acyl carrier protein